MAILIEGRRNYQQSVFVNKTITRQVLIRTDWLRHDLHRYILATVNI